MTESFEDVMHELRKKTIGLCAYDMDECDKYDDGNGGDRCWSCIEDACGRLEQAYNRELEQARDPQRIRGTKPNTFDAAIETLREYRWQHATNETDVIPYINAVKEAHERDMKKMGRTCGDQMWEHGKALGEGNLKQAKKTEYHRGYQDGLHARDTATWQLDRERLAVAHRLREYMDNDRGMDKDGIPLLPTMPGILHAVAGEHEFSPTSAAYKLISLLGGDTDTAQTDADEPDCGHVRECPQYDALGNECHKAVCELQKLDGCSPLAHGFRDALAAAIDVPRDGAPYDDKELCHLICQRLIYLLGGDQPTSGTVWEAWGREWQDRVSKASAESDQSHESSPMSLENETRITDEFRECVETATKTYEGSWYEMDDADHTICHITEGELLGIADRIEEQFARVCELWERTATDTAQSVHDSMEADCNKLQAECDRLTAALDELHADPANDVICRLERERDELRRSLRQIAERAGVPHDRDLSEYSDEKIANAVIGQLGDTNQYVKSLEWVRDKRLPRIEAERDELQSKLEYTKKSLDGMREQREHWADEAIEMFRVFFPHDEYCVPNSPSKMVIPKINEMQKKLDELEKFDHDVSLAAFGDDNEELRKLLSRASKLLANAEQDRDANYANWMDCKAKVVQANTTIDGLQAKLDAIREALDG